MLYTDLARLLTQASVLAAFFFSLIEWVDVTNWTKEKLYASIDPSLALPKYIADAS
jgi:hypothetical protein